MIRQSDIWQKWTDDAVKMALERVKNIRAGKHRASHVVRVHIPHSNVASMPFQSSVDQSNQPFRWQEEAGLIHGGISAKVSRELLEKRAMERARLRRTYAVSRVSQSDKNALLQRTASDRVKFNNNDTVPDPYDYDGNIVNPIYAKAQASLLLDVIETYVYNENFGDKLFQSIDRYFKLMWKVIPTYTDLREYDALIKRWYDMVSTIYDTHQANVLKIRRNRQDLFTPEGHLQETEQRKSGLIYDYVKAVWKFLEANREGINLDMKSKKAILQSSISSFKILEQDFKNREILRSAKDYKKQEDIDADISRVSQFNELPGQGVIDQEDIDSSNRVKLTPAQHRQAREDKEALYDKVVPDLNEVVDFYISLDREGKDRLQIDNLIREQLQDVTEGRNPDVSDPYIRVLLLTYLHYRQRYGIVPDIDVDSEMWNNALIATTNYLYQNAPHAYDPGRPETQYPDAVDGEFDLGDTAQEVIDRINRAPAGVGRGRPRKVGRPRGSKNKKY